MSYELDVYDSDEIILDRIKMMETSTKFEIRNEVTNQLPNWSFCTVYLTDMHTQYEPIRINRYE